MDRQAQGFALISALFVMLIVGASTIAVLRLSIIPVASSSLTLQHARAGLAARAGAEWAAVRATQAGPCAASLAINEVDIQIRCVSETLPGVGPYSALPLRHIQATAVTRGAAPIERARQVATLTITAP